MFAILGAVIAAVVGASAVLCRGRRAGRPHGEQTPPLSAPEPPASESGHALVPSEPELATELLTDDDTIPRAVKARLSRPAAIDVDAAATFRTLPSVGALARLLDDERDPARAGGAGRRYGSYHFSDLLDDPAFALESEHARRPPWNARLSVPAGALTVVGVQQANRWPHIDTDLAGTSAPDGQRFLVIYYTFRRAEAPVADSCDTDPLATWAQLSVLVDGVRQAVPDPHHGQSILVITVPAAAESLAIMLESHGRLDMLNLLSGARRRA